MSMKQKAEIKDPWEKEIGERRELQKVDVEVTWEMGIRDGQSVTVNEFMDTMVSIHSILLEEDYYFDLCQGLCRMATELAQMEPGEEAIPFFGTLEANLNEPECSATLENEVLAECKVMKNEDGTLLVDPCLKWSFRETPTRAEIEKQEALEEEEANWEWEQKHYNE